MTTRARATSHGTDAIEQQLSTAFEVLANRRQRHVIRFLSRQDGPVTLDGLAEEIAGADGDPRRELRDHVRSSLYHRHLPLLLDADVVRYDREVDEVHAAPAADPLVDVLAFAEDQFGDRPG